MQTRRYLSLRAVPVSARRHMCRKHLFRRIRGRKTPPQRTRTGPSSSGCRVYRTGTWQLVFRAGILMRMQQGTNHSSGATCFMPEQTTPRMTQGGIVRRVLNVHQPPLSRFIVPCNSHRQWACPQGACPAVYPVRVLPDRYGLPGYGVESLPQGKPDSRVGSAARCRTAEYAPVSARVTRLLWKRAARALPTIKSPDNAHIPVRCTGPCQFRSYWLSAQ